MTDLMKDRTITMRFTLKALIAEAFALMTLVYCAGWATVFDNMPGTHSAPFQEAIVTIMVLATMIIFTADVSGAQLNPAVSVALSFCKMQKWSTTLYYIVAQLFGSVIGGAMIHLASTNVWKPKIKGSYPLPNYAVYDRWRVFFYEFFGALFLVYGIFHVIDTKGSRFQMAMTVAVAISMSIMAFCEMSGACFNPARVFGPSLVENGVAFPGWYLYWIGPICGGCTGGMVYQLFIKGDSVWNYLPNLRIFRTIREQFSREDAPRA
jgi:glycerol uptake facilitator protein